MTGSVASEARDWLRQAVAFWAEHGIDRARSGFHEHLRPGTLDCTADFRRLRVMTRQIYVFASPIGHDVPGAAEALGIGLAQLRRARHPDGGYASRLTLEGAIADGTRDLYDLAFVLFALSQAFARLKDPVLRDDAHELVWFIQTRMRHSDGGFAEAIPPRQPRRQNPHMHLLEAVLHWEALDPHGPFTPLRDELLVLFATRFYAPVPGIVQEYLTDDLSPLPSPHPVLWEPGHHFEWVWLLDMAERAGGQIPAGLKERLMQRARTDGLHRGKGRVHGELDDAMRVTIPSTRIWTLTEWVKAECVTPGPDREQHVARAWNALCGFLDGPGQGLWHEKWHAASDSFPVEPVPATSLYHISMAVHVMQDCVR